MKRLLLFLLPVAFLLASCSQESEPTIKEKENPSVSSTRVSLEDALKAAEQMFEGLEGDATRATSRRVKTIETIGGEATRSSESDALYYVVNYDDNAGFAVLGADTRLDDVYAFSDEGSLNMADTVFNQGLNAFFRSLPSDPNKLPGMGNGGVEKPDSTIFDIGDLKPLVKNVSVKHGPFLTPSVRKWKQTGRFADYTPNHYPVGDIALACAMVMSANKWPSQYKGKIFDWDTINQWNGESDYSSNANLPYLLYEIGKSLNLYYSEGYTSMSLTDLQQIPITFQTMNYAVENLLFGEPTLNENILIDFLDDWNKPVILMDTTRSSIFYAWVCDGYYHSILRYVNADGTYDYQSKGYYFHFVWGLNGEANGYFKVDNSLGDNRFVHSNYVSESDDFTSEEWNSEKWQNFKPCVMRYWGHATPNK